MRPRLLQATPEVTEHADDSALAFDLQSGRPEAARLLVERYQSLLLGVCSRMLGHRHDAEDVVQETFVRALRSIGGFERGKPLRPWLIGIAVNRCRTWKSRQRLPVGGPALLEAHPDRHPAIQDPDDLAGALQNALGRLRPEYRAVFVLYHEQGLSYDEIAVSVARPVGTVKTWLHRARAQLAADLTRSGHVPPEQRPPSASGESHS